MGVLTGDVLGRGVEAAAVMGQLRSVSRPCAGQDRAAATAADPGDGHVLSTLLPDADGHDDVPLLLTQLPAAPPDAAPPDAATTDLPAPPESVPAGRDFLLRGTEHMGCTGTTDDALLVFSEVLTNAVQHAHGPVGLRVCRTDAGITVESSDRSPLPQPRLAA